MAQAIDGWIVCMGSVRPIPYHHHLILYPHCLGLEKFDHDSSKNFEFGFVGSNFCSRPINRRLRVNRRYHSRQVHALSHNHPHETAVAITTTSSSIPTIRCRLQSTELRYLANERPMGTRLGRSIVTKRQTPWSIQWRLGLRQKLHVETSRSCRFIETRGRIMYGPTQLCQSTV